MHRISVSRFRQEFLTLTEPVEVLKGVETIGVWYPGKAPGIPVDPHAFWSGNFERTVGPTITPKPSDPDRPRS